MPVQILLDGAPLASQLVYASFAGHHAHDASGGHVEAFSGRTDAEGRAVVPLDRAGRWYVRLIHMFEATCSLVLCVYMVIAAGTNRDRHPELMPWVHAVCLATVAFFVK